MSSVTISTSAVYFVVSVRYDKGSGSCYPATLQKPTIFSGLEDDQALRNRRLAVRYGL